MRFWDSSAVVPLLLNEKKSDWARALLATGEGMTVWWGTSVECTSAIARAERDSKPPQDYSSVFGDLELLADRWHEVSPTETIRNSAKRLLRVHSLKAADALQLAAALHASAAVGLPFVTLDEQLVAAAKKEGLAVITI